MFGKADLGAEVFENLMPGYGSHVQMKLVVYEMYPLACCWRRPHNEASVQALTFRNNPADRR